MVRPLVRWLVSLGWMLVIGATFSLGYWLARYEAVKALAGVDALQTEVGMLSEEVARAREERLRLERSHQMDREATRRAQESLAELQRERLDLVKRVSYLQRLVRDGQEGIVEVKELRLREGSAPDAVRYEMLLSQLVPQEERTRGQVKLSVVLSLNGKQEELSLDALPGSSPAVTVIDFEHFQAIAGEIVLPEDAEPEQLIVDTQPDGASMARSIEAFLWPSKPGDTCLPSPIVESIELVGPDVVE
ncbi:MAG: DUF6776 family protein [Lamprobacter sp.]|uniref:DUF6776 family protein n=1 Tax=Lamprobacter sp. TaxID=3100796 RepID=UPI002B263880|nr:DUF6776 family protein [Lamprobacter sp.]MEA3642158.1 DUF6776 family protein [Lamprobacter sp.]